MCRRKHRNRHDTCDNNWTRENPNECLNQQRPEEGQQHGDIRTHRGIIRSRTIWRSRTDLSTTRREWRCLPRLRWKEMVVLNRQKHDVWQWESQEKEDVPYHWRENHANQWGGLERRQSSNRQMLTAERETSMTNLCSHDQSSVRWAIDFIDRWKTIFVFILFHLRSDVDGFCSVSMRNEVRSTSNAFKEAALQKSTWQHFSFSWIFLHAFRRLPLSFLAGMRVFIQNHAKCTLSIEIERSDKLASAKTKNQEKTVWVDPWCQRLIHAGQTMDDRQDPLVPYGK